MTSFDKDKELENTKKDYECSLKYLKSAKENLNKAILKIDLLNKKINFKNININITFLGKQSIISIKNIINDAKINIESIIKQFNNQMNSNSLDEILEYLQNLNKDNTDEVELNEDVHNVINDIEMYVQNAKNDLNKLNNINELSNIINDISKIPLILIIINKEITKNEIVDEFQKENTIVQNIIEEPVEKSIEEDNKLETPIEKILEVKETQNFGIIEDENIIPKKKTKMKLKKSVSNALVIIFLFGVMISTYNIVRWYLSSKKTNQMIDVISKTVNFVEEEKEQKYNVNFQELKAINSDVVAWLKVNGTNIEYPVVKGKDNDYYLNHSLNKEYNNAGWIFMDYRDIFDGTDDNIIIYGHNMYDKTMFYSLRNVITPEWYKNKENHQITFISENEQAKYQVFSTYKINAQDYETITKYNDTEDFNKYLSFIKNKSVYNFDTEITSDDQILTISTCADNSNYRIILHAKKIK